MNASNPLVSVIIPTYNRAQLLLDSIASVQSQSYKNIEIIVVDDGSTDATKEVIAHLADNDIRYIRHERNLGANVARNTGIRAAHGEFVAFQDSDDTWYPEKLSKQIYACKESNAQVCFCSFNRVTNDVQQVIPKSGYKLQAGYHDFHSALMKGSFISCQTLLISKKLIIQANMFDETLPRLQDWELCLRLSSLTRFCFLEESLVNVRVQPDSISNDYEKYVIAVKAILRKHSSKFNTDEVARAILYLNIALKAIQNKHFSHFLKYTLKSLVVSGIQFPSLLLFLIRRR